MTSAYEVAQALLDKGWTVTCIPVQDQAGRHDVAVVALEPSIVIAIALEHERRDVRTRGSLALAAQAHKLIQDKGLTFRCRSST